MIRQQDPQLPFNQRLAEAARSARDQAKLLEAGPLRDALLEKAREFEAQIEINEILKL
jgi:hypothetical protein